MFFIGFISWLLGTLLALPLGRLMSDGIGYAMFQIPLNYAFSANGIGLWLLIVIVLSAIASVFACPQRVSIDGAGDVGISVR
ncbi:hypothetical protein KFU94_26505 [Chloroflexi bacterium TSY]|nr:hypothetical protein [Chloroflexi bacterium TSY]